MSQTSCTKIDAIACKPFVKWVGGKRSALGHLKTKLPKDYTNYYECFLGGGALFFATQPEKATLSDINHNLIITYAAIKKDVDKVILELKKHKRNNSKEYFLKKRKQFNREKDKFKLAGIFIYLNKTCFNGLYRVNSKGEFNVPYGKYKNPPILDEITLRNVSRFLKTTKLSKKTFDEVKIEKGAFYYLDPPYHKTFDQYDKNQFNLDDHKNLRDFCKKLDKVGAYFMLSNSNTKCIKDLYKGFRIEVIQAGKSVSCKSSGRGKEKELVIRNYG